MDNIFDKFNDNLCEQLFEHLTFEDILAVCFTCQNIKNKIMDSMFDTSCKMCIMNKTTCFQRDCYYREIKCIGHSCMKKICVSNGHYVEVKDQQMKYKLTNNGEVKPVMTEIKLFAYVCTSCKNGIHWREFDKIQQLPVEDNEDMPPLEPIEPISKKVEQKNPSVGTRNDKRIPQKQMPANTEQSRKQKTLDKLRMRLNKN